jgi:very-short-patch-repair endonuclease
MGPRLAGNGSRARPVKRTEQERQDFITVAAATMARNPTPAERRLWTALEPLGWRRQVVVSVPRLKHPERRDYYILDFYYPKLRRCIEVDGGYHSKRRGRDRRRDMRLAVHGIRTLRLTNRQVLDKYGLAALVARIEMWRGT